MAERIPVAQVTVNRTGDWSSFAEPPVEFAPPLSAPGGNAAARRPVIPPPPPPPSEAELRERLAAAIEARRVAEVALQHAQAAAERADRHRDRCANALRGFAGLDDEITAATVEQLRSDGRRVDLPDFLRQRLNDREIAKVDLATAERAATMLAGEHNAARAVADAAAKSAKQVAAAILALEAERLVVRHDDLLAEAAQLRELLAAFDRVVASAGGSLPLPVLTVLRQHEVRLTAPLDLGVWREALDALLADPMAVVEVG